ncbi:MAG: hypothetical protein IIA90_05255 [Chloroflexi bacterium]|nr:hypothetical protein [Chloroflexota bacterium]
MPSPWQAIGRLVSRVTSPDLWALTSEDEAGNGRDYTRFVALLGLFSLVALAGLIIVLIATLVSGDSSQSTGPTFDSPSPAPTTPAPTTPATTVPGGLTDAPWIDAQLLQDDPLAAADILWDTGLATDSLELVSAANYIRQAIAIGLSIDLDIICPLLDQYNADYSSGPTGAPACDDTLVAPPL